MRLTMGNIYKQPFENVLLVFIWFDIIENDYREDYANVYCLNIFDPLNVAPLMISMCRDSLNRHFSIAEALLST